MSPSLSPSSLSLLAAALLLLLRAAASAATFPNCDRTFSCGSSLSRLTYPFTGGDRPAHCGPPQFRLTCRDNAYAELTAADSVTYRVLQLNTTRKTLVLARSDLWNNTCPKKFLNSTLDPTAFSYGGETEDLCLVYGCSSLTNYTPYNQFNCVVSGANNSNAFYLVGPVPIDPILSIITTCFVTVTVPVIGDAARKLTGNRTTLRETLMEGFSVNYMNPYANHCSNCTNFGGQCGFDTNLSEPICICGGDQYCSVPIVTGGSNSNSIKIVLPIVGAILAGIGLGWLIFSCRQRKKLKAAQSTQAESKDISSPPLSKSLTTPRSNFTRSIPSYPSSKSDFGKASTYFGVQVFSYSELEEATNNFDPSRELGEGGFGTVYYGQLQDGRIVAVKRLYENNFKRVEQFMNEVEILTRLRHDYLVTLFGCTSKRSRELLLVYEYIPNGTVADHLHGKRSNSGLLSWPVRSVRRMTTLVAELAFRCLQMERDMRPSMEEVLKALRGIKDDGSNLQVDVVDIVLEDDVGILKDNPPPMSPDSAATATSTEKWVSSSTAPNSIG
ncbi:serine/threonine kinase family catalytic domain protein [Actinidia rufa]|uniref:non-specific serine/threonine protein kinase n=1 Tax=Actinidia rufa TaxID=165716 RepID=A0A7J0DK12_9ERIC|nr:serine/threonine kinase family catalytic domain protein [Actinidia rufa]